MTLLKEIKMENITT